MNKILFVGLLFPLLCIGILIFILLSKKRIKNLLTSALSLQLFEISLPPLTMTPGTPSEKEIPLPDYLKNIENFFSSLAGILAQKSFIAKLSGSFIPIVFEIAIHRIGEEVHFYVATPRRISELITKQVLGYWPKAQVKNVQDYNIFNPSGFSIGAFAILKKSPFLPLKPAKDFRQDPLSVFTSIFTKLKKEGEGAAVQLVVTKSRKKIGEMTKKVARNLQQGKTLREALFEAQKGWLSHFLKVISPTPKPTQPQTQIPPPTPVIDQELVALLHQKGNLPIFDTNIRVLASAETKERAEEILLQLESAFSQFNSAFNEISFKHPKGRALKRLFYYFSFRIFDKKSTIPLSSEELGNIFHLPLPTLFAPFVKWVKSKQAPAPPELPQEGIVLGKNVFRGEEKMVRILKDDRRRHLYIIGQTGTGKSTLLLEMMRQDMEQGEGVGIVDPHGDLAEKILAIVPPNRIEDVVYFNPADIQRPIGLNMLEYEPSFPESKTFVVNEMLEIFEKLYNLKATGFGGPVFEQYMRNALLLVMDDPETGNTLLEVPRVLSDPKFRKLKLSKCKNIVVRNFWELEAEKAGGEMALANIVPYITSKMNIFIANDLVRPIIAQQKSTIDFREVIDTNKILVVNLSKGRLGEINSYLLGMIIIGKLLLAAYSRTDIPEEERKDFFLYIDEFHNVTTKTITNALAEVRKFRLNLILAHQYIGQLDEETKKGIFGNVGTILTFRVGPDDAKYLVTQFGPTFDEQDLVNFDNYNGAIRLLIKGVSSKPFSIQTLPPHQGEKRIAELVKEHSRIRYGGHRDIIEKEILERLTKLMY